MSAKDKLNAIHFNGALIVAGVAGLATGSFIVFGAVMVGALVMCVASGDIR